MFIFRLSVFGFILQCFVCGVSMCSSGRLGVSIFSVHVWKLRCFKLRVSSFRCVIFIFSVFRCGGVGVVSLLVGWS